MPRCFVEGRATSDFLLDGAAAAMIVADPVAPNDSTRARCRRQRCDDGVLVDEGACEATTVAFSCRAQDDNAGCAGTATCPANHELLAATAVCDLEGASLASGALAAARPGTVEVTRASDVVADGLCTVGSAALSTGFTFARAPAGALRFGCRERDQGGGDCEVAGTLYCRPSP